MNFDLKKIFYLVFGLLVIGAVFSIVGVSLSGNIQFAFNFSAIILAILYLWKGYLKEGYLYCRVLIGFIAAKEAIGIVNTATKEYSLKFAFVIALLTYTCLIVLAFSKEYGTRKTVYISLSNIALTVVNLILAFLNMLTINMDKLSSVFNASTQLFLAIFIFVMIYNKKGTDM